MATPFYIFIIAVHGSSVKGERGDIIARLLQHSSASVTQRYIGIEPQRIERAIEGHAELI